MATPSSPHRERLIYSLAALAVVIVLVGLGVIYLNRANGGDRVAINAPSTTATPLPVASATATASASSSAQPSQVAFADCSTATFGAALAPLNPPSTVHTYAAAPAMTIDVNKLYLATIHTAKGDIGICLQPSLAPNTVNNFVTLARNHFYDGLIFHRVGPNQSTPAMAQGGDPNCVTGTETTCGNGGPGYSFNDEPVLQAYVAGAVAMANSGPNTNGSQFFIDNDVNQFAPSYNLFGHVSSGLDVVKKIVKGDAMITVTVAEQT